jgi:hypothetical protein
MSSDVTEDTTFTSPTGDGQDIKDTPRKSINVEEINYIPCLDHTLTEDSNMQNTLKGISEALKISNVSVDSDTLNRLASSFIELFKVTRAALPKNSFKHISDSISVSILRKALGPGQVGFIDLDGYVDFDLIVAEYNDVKILNMYGVGLVCALILVRSSSPSKSQRSPEAVKEQAHRMAHLIDSFNVKMRAYLEHEHSPVQDNEGTNKLIGNLSCAEEASLLDRLKKDKVALGQIWEAYSLSVRRRSTFSKKASFIKKEFQFSSFASFCRDFMVSPHLFNVSMLREMFEEALEEQSISSLSTDLEHANRKSLVFDYFMRLFVQLAIRSSLSTTFGAIRSSGKFTEKEIDAGPLIRLGDFMGWLDVSGGKEKLIRERNVCIRSFHVSRPSRKKESVEDGKKLRRASMTTKRDY